MFWVITLMISGLAMCIGMGFIIAALLDFKRELDKMDEHDSY